VLPVSVPALEVQFQALRDKVLEEINQRNSKWLDQEIGKLDRWSEDKKFALEQEIKDLDQQIRDAKRASTAAMTLADKLVQQRTLKAFQATRNEKRKDLFTAQDEVEARRDSLISEIEARMTTEQQSEVFFTIRWSLE
jgi:adenine-specific DNA-methyltransferase